MNISSFSGGRKPELVGSLNKSVAELEAFNKAAEVLRQTLQTPPSHYVSKTDQRQIDREHRITQGKPVAAWGSGIGHPVRGKSKPGESLNVTDMEYSIEEDVFESGHIITPVVFPRSPEPFKLFPDLKGARAREVSPIRETPSTTEELSRIVSNLSFSKLNGSPSSRASNFSTEPPLQGGSLTDESRRTTLNASLPNVSKSPGSPEPRSASCNSSFYLSDAFLGGATPPRKVPPPLASLAPLKK